ncbi:hypothetical protein GF406_02725 [candidate division KSB1 bacterium]|jgi:hypothetical protein|nr:hypothetical protein [candidate division KSB1 bacterium]
MKLILHFMWFSFVLTQPISAQFTKRSTGTGEKAKIPVPVVVHSYMNKPVELIDMPTAGILRAGDLQVRLRFYEQGSLIGRLSAGISDRLMFGVSFGGEHIIGGEQIQWQEKPGIHFIYRLVEESLLMPAIVLGIDTQGYGKYWREEDYRDPAFPNQPVEVNAAQYPLNRFSFKSRGFYSVVSKGYQSIRQIGLHAGINYSLDTNDNDKGLNVFMGANIELIPNLALIGEYDFALNDDRIKYMNNGRGYLNAGLRWAITPGMSIEYDLKNIIDNNDERMGLRRIVRIVYHGSIIP